MKLILTSYWGWYGHHFKLIPTVPTLCWGWYRDHVKLIPTPQWSWYGHHIEADTDTILSWYRLYVEADTDTMLSWYRHTHVDSTPIGILFSNMDSTPRHFRFLTFSDHYNTMPLTFWPWSKQYMRSSLWLPRYRGRRHSVAVPLIPPPDGETFEGGYRIERNPITGGARLIPPPAGIHTVLYCIYWCMYCTARTICCMHIRYQNAAVPTSLNIQHRKRKLKNYVFFFINLLAANGMFKKIFS